MSTYAAITHEGAEVTGITAGSPLAAMQLAAERCGPGDWPVALYATDCTGAWVRPAWGGKRGLASEYPPGETPEDAARMFGPAGEPA